MRIEQTRIQEFLTLAEELGVKGLAEDESAGLAEMEAGGAAPEPELAESVSEQDRRVEANTPEPELVIRRSLEPEHSKQEESLKQGQVRIYSDLH